MSQDIPLAACWSEIAIYFIAAYALLTGARDQNNACSTNTDQHRDLFEQLAVSAQNGDFDKVGALTFCG